MGQANEFTISSGDLNWDDDAADDDNCVATIEVRRTLSGEVDPAFEEGGSFDASQVRSVDITSVP